MPRFLKMCSLDQWERDGSVPHCRRCHIPFSITVRRHHCRSCGKIFCGTCSNSLIPMAEENGTSIVQGQRCCMECISKPSKEIEDALDAIEEQKQHAEKNVPTLSQLKKQQHQSSPSNSEQQPKKKVSNTAGEQNTPQKDTRQPIISNTGSANSSNSYTPVSSSTHNASPEAAKPAATTTTTTATLATRTSANNNNNNNNNNDNNDEPQQPSLISSSSTIQNNNDTNNNNNTVEDTTNDKTTTKSLNLNATTSNPNHHQQQRQPTSGITTTTHSSMANSTTTTNHADDPARRAITKKVLDLIISSGWTPIRTPTHQIVMPQLIHSELEFYSLVVPNTRTKAYKLCVDIDASLMAASTLLSSMDLMGKLEPDVESRTTAFDCGGGVMKVATRYKGTSVISAREFRTKSSSHELSEAEVAKLIMLGLNELPAGGYVSGTINDDDKDDDDNDNTDELDQTHSTTNTTRSSSSTSNVSRILGEVHAFGLVVCAVKQLHPVRPSQQILRVSFISHTDPKGRLPAFALESPTLQDMIKRLNLFCTVIHSLDLTICSGDDDEQQQQQQQNPLHSLTSHSSQNGDSKNNSTGISRLDSESGTGSPLAGTVKSLDFTTTSNATTICPSRRRVITPLLRLFNSSQWVSESCKEPGFSVASAVVPRTRVKAHLVTCKINCSLFTFADIVGDSSLVPKYDANIHVFKADRTLNPRVASVYSAYKRASRLIEPRDFAVASAHIFLGEDDVQREVAVESLKLHGHAATTATSTSSSNSPFPVDAAFVQNALDSHMIPPKEGFVRGNVHAYGFVATCRDSEKNPNEIVVSCVSCVDPCGNIPTFVLDSAFNDDIAKLKIISRLCEEKQLKAPSKTRSLSKLESRTSSFASLHSAAEHDDSIGASKMTSLHASPDSKKDRSSGKKDLFSIEDIPRLDHSDENDHTHDNSYSDFIRRGENSSSDDSLITCEDMDGLDELEKDDVLAAVIDLQRAQGWSNPSSIKNCRVETRLTAISNVQAVRTYREFKCSLETFKAKLHDLDTLKQLDSSLENIEFLFSPTYGQVVFTSHKTTSVFVSPREFCTLNCEKMLSTEEAANIGLCTPGMNAAAFVSSGVDAPPEFTKHEVRKGYIRGKVYAFGYVALATPPNAKRIRVYNVALVDPCGQIPAKAVQYAIGENAQKMDRFAKICEAVEKGEEAPALDSTVTNFNNMMMNNNDDNNNHSPPSGSNTNNNNDDNAVPEELINDVHPLEPLHHMMTHQSSMTWTPLTSPNPQACKVEKTGSGHPHVIRVKIEVKATLSTLERAFKSSSYSTVLQKLLETQSIAQTLKKEAKLVKIKLSPGFMNQKQARLTSIVVDSKNIDKEEGPHYNLFTEGFNGGAFSFAAQSPPVDLDCAESKANHVSFVELLGCTAVAVPVNAKRVRCTFWFAETIYAPGKKDAIDCSGDGSAQAIATAFAQGVLKVAAYVESIQKEVGDLHQLQEVAPNSAPNFIESTNSTVMSQEAESTPEKQKMEQQHENENDNEVKQQKEQVNPEPEQEEQQQQQQVLSLPPRAVPLGVEQEQEPVIKLLLDLYKDKDKWSTPPREAHGCTLQDMAVPFCDKKALKMELVMRCSIFTFVRFLFDKYLIPQYDPSMERMEEVAQKGRVKTIYTPYKQASRFITARDFAFDSTLAVVSADDAHLPNFLKKSLQSTDEVILSSNVHNKSFPEKAGFVRGILHLYGYIVHPEGVGKIRVTCLCSADPSGRIPASLVDAAAAENCKKLVVIKNLCEAMHAEKPLVDWYFDPLTGESTMEAHKAKMMKEEEERKRKKAEQQDEKTTSSTVHQNVKPSQDLQEMGGPLLISASSENTITEQEDQQQEQEETKIIKKNRSISDGASPQQMKLLSQVIDLFRSDKWSSPPKEAHGCTLQNMDVPFCTKKALRMELVMRCSLESFGAVLLNSKLTKKYDPTLVEMKQFADVGGDGSGESIAGKIMSFHATYAQQSRFITARDFAFDSTLAILKRKNVFSSGDAEKQQQQDSEVLVSSAVHNSSFPEQSGFVRGILHVYGYVATATAPDRIRVTCIACADPSGRIPAALVDAAAGESCRKLSIIRDICEEEHQRDPKRDWHF